MKARAVRFEQSLLDDIRTRLPISDVVGRRVTWDRRKSQPAKGDYWACCPFHQEKTPSFHVDDRRGIYKCFGCGAAGDHFRFLTETEGVTFPEAVERLAEEAGVVLPARDPEAERRARERASLSDIMDMAAAYFEAELAADKNAPIRAYVAGRRLEPETVKEFRIGFAPDGRDRLKRHLMTKGVDERDLIETGLVIKPDDGRASYDRFRNRLIIPIQDERGRIVAFGGRAVDPDTQPKYLNSPETKLFHKGMILFNGHRARKAAFEAGTVIVTEGYLDAIAIWQAGLTHVVATLGTAFTEDQIKRLWRYAPEPIVCFDGDRAGTAAAHRAVDRILPALEAGRSFNFVFLPEGKDPDDLIGEGGLGRFRAELEHALPLSEVLWEREVAGTPIDTPERKAALERRLEKIIGEVGDSAVAHRYRLSYRVRLSDLFWKSDRSRRPAAPDRSPPPESGHHAGLERIVLGLCIERPDLLQEALEDVVSVPFSVPSHNHFKQELHRIVVDLDQVDVAAFYAAIDPKFFALLDDIHGGEGDEEKARETGSRLKRRFPILRLRPPPDFVRNCFRHLLDLLTLRVMEADLSAEIGDAGGEIDAGTERRVLAMTRDVARRREELARRERELAEEAALIRSARGASSAGGALLDPAA